MRQCFLPSLLTAATSSKRLSSTPAHEDFLQEVRWGDDAGAPLPNPLLLQPHPPLSDPATLRWRTKVDRVAGGAVAGRRDTGRARCFDFGSVLPFPNTHPHGNDGGRAGPVSSMLSRQSFGRWKPPSPAADRSRRLKTDSHPPASDRTLGLGDGHVAGAAGAAGGAVAPSSPTRAVDGVAGLGSGRERGAISQPGPPPQALRPWETRQPPPRDRPLFSRPCTIPHRGRRAGGGGDRSGGTTEGRTGHRWTAT